MTTLCPECDFAPCICGLLQDAGVTAQAIDEVTREMMMGESAAFAQFLVEDLDMGQKQVESVRKDGTAINSDGFTEELMEEARRMANWDEWRRAFAERSVIDLDFQRRLTDEDREFLRGCLDWDSRLTRYDKRFLRGCGVKP